MCTAIAYKTKDFYFGRTLDYDFSYNENVVITPRNYKFDFVNGKRIENHYALIGMAYVVGDYPLYYDATNEKGLSMAGLNFVGNAYYGNWLRDKDNVASFEFIPWLLSQCATVQEARVMLDKINLTSDAFSRELPPSQLHWMLADKSETLVVESVKEGLKIYDNPVGVLTNNPPFDEQSFNLNNYMSLSAKEPENTFCADLPLYVYSRGMGALGLPGDLSSQSRFVRATFVKLNSIADENETDSVNQFFHILSSVEQQRGCCRIDDGYEITIYSSCCNSDRGIYYYTTYGNHQISAVDMNKENLNDNTLIKYPLLMGEQIKFQN
ncbi:MAG: choloylglycine hydrolase [Clostridia bacterium]|nr:choloylglycine hydrolase [Clostridia bacterium]